MTKKILPLLVLVVLLMPAVAFGQIGVTCNDNPGSTLPPCSNVGFLGPAGDVGNQSAGATTPIDISTVTTTILQLVNWFSWFVGLAAVVMGLYSGFLFITARDNANQLVTARQTMMYAIIGIGVAILAFSLVSISKSILNL